MSGKVEIISKLHKSDCILVRFILVDFLICAVFPLKVREKQRAYKAYKIPIRNQSNLQYRHRTRFVPNPGEIVLFRVQCRFTDCVC